MPVNPRAKGERAVLAGRSGRGARPGDELTELRLLAETAGANVAGEVLQRRGPVRASTFLSKGKVEEVRELAGELAATLLLLDDDLSPAQARNLLGKIHFSSNIVSPTRRRDFEDILCLWSDSKSNRPEISFDLPSIDGFAEQSRHARQLQ